MNELSIRDIEIINEYIKEGYDTFMNKMIVKYGNFYNAKRKTRIVVNQNGIIIIDVDDTSGASLYSRHYNCEWRNRLQIFIDKWNASNGRSCEDVLKNMMNEQLFKITVVE